MILIKLLASAHTGDTGIDEYPDISGITTARVSNALIIQYSLHVICIVISFFNISSYYSHMCK